MTEVNETTPEERARAEGWLDGFKAGRQSMIDWATVPSDEVVAKLSNYLKSKETKPK